MRRKTNWLALVGVLATAAVAMGAERNVPPPEPLNPPAAQPQPQVPTPQPEAPTPQPAAPGQKNGKVLYVGDAQAPAVAQMTEGGIQVEVAPALPANYLEYNCIVMERADCNPVTAEKLYFMLRGANGAFGGEPGGVVLLRGAPALLAGAKTTRDDARLGTIAGWFGYEGLFHEQKSNLNASVNRPLDLDAQKDFRFGESSGFYANSPARQAPEEMCLLRDGGWVGAFARRIWGGGRLYYQGGLYTTEGKLKPFLAAGVQWAGGLKKIEDMLDEAAPVPAPANSLALYVGQENAPVVRVLREYGGFNVRVAPELPTDLTGFALVAMERDGCSPAAADALLARLKAGGGVMLVGYAPGFLAGSTDAKTDCDLKPIIGWLGFAKMHAPGESGTNIQRDNPFGLPWAKNTGWDTTGYYLTEQRNDADPQLKGEAFRVLGDGGWTMSFGRALAQGGGRLYYQGGLYDERVEFKEILAGGARWAARAIDEP